MIISIHWSVLEMICLILKRLLTPCFQMLAQLMQFVLVPSKACNIIIIIPLLPSSDKSTHQKLKQIFTSGHVSDCVSHTLNTLTVQRTDKKLLISAGFEQQTM